MESEGSSSSMMEQAARLNKRRVIAGIQQKIDTMSPMQTQAGGIHGCVVYSIYEHFFYKAAQHGETLKSYPLLLTSVVPIDKLQTFRLNLRKDVTFHNGDRMTARDIVASIEAYSSKASIYNHFKDVTNMTIVDDHTVDMTWRENTLTNLTYLRHKRLPKIYREAAKYAMDNALMIWLLWMVVYSAATKRLKVVRWWGERGYMPYMTSVLN